MPTERYAKFLEELAELRREREELHAYTKVYNRIAERREYQEMFER